MQKKLDKSEKENDIIQDAVMQICTLHTCIRYRLINNYPELIDSVADCCSSAVTCMVLYSVHASVSLTVCNSIYCNSF